MDVVSKSMRILWAGVFCIILIALTGCSSLQGGTNPLLKASDEISFNRGQVALAYADMKAGYVMLRHHLSLACASGKLDEQTCIDIAKANEKMADVETQIRRAIANPHAVVDWEAVSKGISLITELAIKFGVGI